MSGSRGPQVWRWLRAAFSLGATLICVFSGSTVEAAGENPLAAPTDDASPRSEEAPRVWEINGIRLEADQVERLARDMAERTLEAVEKSVEGIDLDPDQRSQMLDIYRSVALDVYARIVDVVNGAGLDDSAKEARVRELVLSGQERSHLELQDVLRRDQLERYTVWEQAQVQAYENAQNGRGVRRRRR